MVSQVIPDLIHNVLNGTPVEDAANVAGISFERAQEIVDTTLRLVGEYNLTQCEPWFPCQNPDEARHHRLKVFNIIERIAYWDSVGRPFVMSLLSGQRDKVKELLCGHGLTREQGNSLFADFLIRVPNYLGKTEIGEFARDQVAFVRANRKRIMEIADRMPSFTNGARYKRIEIKGIHQE